MSSVTSIFQHLLSTWSTRYRGATKTLAANAFLKDTLSLLETQPRGLSNLWPLRSRLTDLPYHVTVTIESGILCGPLQFIEKYANVLEDKIIFYSSKEQLTLNLASSPNMMVLSGLAHLSFVCVYT